MLYHIGIENNVEGRCLAWALEHPGCFAYGETGDYALAAMPDTILDYAQWVASRNHGQSWVDAREIELFLAETWDVYQINEAFDQVEEGYEVNAWYLYDWKPLTEADVERGLKLLDWSRQDLLSLVESLSPPQLSEPHPGERWSIAGILNHIGGAEWWYLDRLGQAFPRQDVPKDPFERLQAVRAKLTEVLHALVGSKQVVGVNGEFWSPRKLLRRAAWHERDHTWHIQKLIYKV